MFLGILQILLFVLCNLGGRGETWILEGQRKVIKKVMEKSNEQWPSNIFPEEYFYYNYSFNYKLKVINYL